MAARFRQRRTGTTKRPSYRVVVADNRTARDGRFVEAKEHIGGFYIINAEDLDEALAWAEKVVEAINHAIEVRPFRATGRVQAGP